MAPSSVAASASAKMRILYSAVNLRRFGLARTSASTRGRGPKAAPVLPAAPLRCASLRSASLRYAAGKTAGGTTAIFLFSIFLFSRLILHSALLTLRSYGRCLSYVGMEGVRNNQPDKESYTIRPEGDRIELCRNAPCGAVASWDCRNDDAIPPWRPGSRHLGSTCPCS